jgi:hypothetical protein
MREVAAETYLLCEGIWVLLKRHAYEVTCDVLMLTGLLTWLAVGVLLLDYLV